MVLMQWMALPGGWQQDSPEVRVARKDDAEHVPYLALIPIRRGPDISDRWQHQIVGKEPDLETDICVARKRQQVINHGEIARRLALAVDADALIDGGEVVKHAIRQLHFQL